MKSLNNQWDELAPKLNVDKPLPVAKVPKYKAVKGDPVDELMQYHL